MIVVGRFTNIKMLIPPDAYSAIIKYYSTVKSGKHKGKIYLCRKRSTALKFHNVIDAKYWIDLHKLEGVELFRYEYSSCISGKP